MAGEILRRGRATPATTEVSRKDQTLLDALEHGELFWFGDWPVVAVPRSGAIVYTVWNRSGQFIYVGMAGRGETSAARGSGPFGRLNSHASGRRSGDQFCVYVCDRLVLPTLRDRIDGRRRRQTFARWCDPPVRADRAGLSDGPRDRRSRGAAGRTHGPAGCAAGRSTVPQSACLMPNLANDTVL